MPANAGIQRGEGPPPRPSPGFLPTQEWLWMVAPLIWFDMLGVSGRGVALQPASA